MPDFKKQPLHLPSRRFFANMSAFLQLVGHSWCSFVFFSLLPPSSMHLLEFSFNYFNTHVQTQWLQPAVLTVFCDDNQHRWYAAQRISAPSWFYMVSCYSMSWSQADSNLNEALIGMIFLYFQSQMVLWISITPWHDELHGKKKKEALSDFIHLMIIFMRRTLNSERKSPRFFVVGMPVNMQIMILIMAAFFLSYQRWNAFPHCYSLV